MYNAVFVMLLNYSCTVLTISNSWIHAFLDFGTHLLLDIPVAPVISTVLPLKPFTTEKLPP